MFEFWYRGDSTIPMLNLGKEYDKSYIRYLGANKKEFVTALATAPKYHFIAHDEALKDLYARDAISDFNKSLNRCYFIIRGKNLITAFCCPSILDLDPQFRKRRISGMLHVYAKGKVAYYGRDKLNKLIPALAKMSIYSARPDPKNALDLNGRLIAPDFTDTFPLYEGVLLEDYLKRKDANMESTVQDLVNKFGGDEVATDSKIKKKGGSAKSLDLFYDDIKELAQQGKTNGFIQKKLGVGYRVVHEARAEMKKQEKYERTLNSIT